MYNVTRKVKSCFFVFLGRFLRKKLASGLNLVAVVGFLVGSQLTFACSKSTIETPE